MINVVSELHCMSVVRQLNDRIGCEYFELSCDIDEFEVTVRECYCTNSFSKYVYNFNQQKIFSCIDNKLELLGDKLYMKNSIDYASSEDFLQWFRDRIGPKQGRL